MCYHPHVSHLRKWIDASHTWDLLVPRAWTHIDFEVLTGRNINSPVCATYIRKYQVFVGKGAGSLR